MLALAFLNPVLLWALPLAAVPIVIHLLNRRRFQRVPWAAMEFLLAAMKRNRKRLRMEQWLVLLLRTLAVMFLVLLVTRPQLSGGGLLGTRTHHVVLLDDTASMRQRSGSLALFDKAQDQVRQLVDRLADQNGGDLFSLVRTSRPQQPDLWSQRIGPDLGRRVGALAKELPSGDGAMDLGAALAETLERALETEEAGRTEYYLVSDVRRIDWLDDEERPRAQLQSVLSAMDKEKTHVTAMAVGSRDADNLAITGVRRQGRLAIANVPVDLAIDVQNHGLDSSQATELAIEVDGKSRVVQPVPQLAPGERYTVEVLHTFGTAGHHRVEASLPTVDYYPTDDRRTLAIPVQERSKVLLVDGDPGETASDGETLFLQVALDPGPEATSGIEPLVITEGQLAETELAPFDMVWLCNVPTPSPAVADKLQRFVAAGGGLVIFCGAQVDPERYNEMLWRGGEGILPLPLGEIAGDPDRPDRVALVDKNHPICGSLGDAMEVICNVAVLVKRHLTVVEDPAAKGARVLARIRDAEGTPIIVSRTFGSGGEVVLFSISADKHWSNWPDTFANVVFAQQTHRFATRALDLDPQNLEPSGTFALELDPGVYKGDVAVRALGEGGEEHTFTATQGKPPTVPEGEAPRAAPLQLSIPMGDLRTLGAYEVGLEQHNGTPETRVIARNAPRVESRLVRFLATDFTRVYPPELHDLVTFRDEASGFGTATGEGELWRALAAAMLAALLLESLLAWRFGRR